MNMIVSILLMMVTLMTSCLGSKNGDDGCIDESKVKPDQMCAAVYTPVCGCDGKTYGNPCEANRAGVTSFTNGECPDKNE